ncbi:MAG: uracil-DNA glycosylase [Planctomycetales bacterium]|nr:uracil-DNA glycosylase [Planctomycetales bacterium]
MSSRTVQQYLQMLSSAGIRFLPKVNLPAFAAKPLRSGAAGSARKALAAATSAPRSGSTTVVTSKAAVQQPDSLPETQDLLRQTFTTAEAKQAGLCILMESVATCRRCAELADTRKQTVFGVGNASARIMFIGEAPGADEDRQGEPFVGPAGQLLNRIITASGLKREDLYICNVLKCRPPGNRDPLPGEIQACSDYLDRQIDLVDPLVIVTLGRFSMARFFPAQTISRIHGKARQTAGRYYVPMYHPAAALHQQNLRPTMLEDFRTLGTTLASAREQAQRASAEPGPRPEPESSTPASDAGPTTADKPDQIRLFD